MEFDEEVSEYERLRENNIKELELLFLQKDPEIQESIRTLNNYKRVKSHAKRRKKENDATFVYSGPTSFEIRRSSRLLNVTPEYSFYDLIDEEEEPKSRKYSDDVDDLEKVVFRKRQSTTRKSSTYNFVPVEQISDTYLANVATRVQTKVYCTNKGTSCHQCRQKTLDSKTYCRSGRCIGVRGQFCGVCLRNRYGEDIVETLMNPKWECPPCRGLCNCSICRAREGKRPTGILAPLAFQYGHKSVKDFLLSLKGEGDYIDVSSRRTHINDNKPKNYGDNNQYLLGFDRELKPVWILRSKKRLRCYDEDQSDLIGFNGEKEPVLTRI